MSAPGTQGVRDASAPHVASGAREEPPERASGIAGLIQWAMALRPTRVVLHFNEEHGPLIAAGLTYQALFALFAALWFAFSVAGFVVEGDPALQEAVFRTINSFIPGLIAYDGNTGAIPAETLLQTSALTLSTVLSLIGVLWTAVGFLGTLRTAIRVIFGIPMPKINFFLLKLGDLGYAVGFGTVVLLTTALSLLSNTVLDAVFRALGLGEATTLQQVATTALTALVLLIVDTLLLAAAYRVLSGIPVPLGRLMVGAVIGGIGLAALQTIGTSLLGGSKSNPILGTFATAVGLLLYFNFVCQVLLIAASWIAVGMQDARIDPRALSKDERELEDAEHLEDARRLIADADRQALEQRVREAHGLERRRLARALRDEVRAEAQRRSRVPTVEQFHAAQKASGHATPDADEIAAVAVGPTESSGADR